MPLQVLSNKKLRNLCDIFSRSFYVLKRRTISTSLHKNHPGRRTTIMTAPYFLHNSEAMISFPDPSKALSLMALK